MKRIILAITLIAVVMLAGCTTTAELKQSDTVEIPPAEGSPTSNIIYKGDEIIPKLAEGFGIYGSTVEFDGVYPGWSGTVPITIVNGQDRDRLFVISVRSPSKTSEGYEPLPQEYFYWITISQPTVTVLAGGVHQIPITLTMPSDANYSGRAEVRIRVEDTTQTGLVQIALETKWFINIAD